MYLCTVKTTCRYLLLFAVLLILDSCGEQNVNPLKRSRVDGWNKESFLNRYRAPRLCVEAADKALAYVADSLPDYVDGSLRALNNKAFAYYQMSDFDQAEHTLDSLEQLINKRARDSRNADIEWLISRLLKARILQRQCHIADSYRLLYDIGQSGVLEHNRDNLLYNYAQTEYYITLLTLNFHYRDGKESDVRLLVREVEERRDRLKVDFAQDMALNYALAFGLQSAGESERALDYCYRNFDILESAGGEAFCLFHYANTLQMAAYALSAIPGSAPPDSVLSLYDEALHCFYDYGDPYQMMGGVTSTARYALRIGDTATAHEVLAEWRSLKGLWTPFAAPKMELGYFDVLIRSGLGESASEVARWYDRRCGLQDYISRNEQEDFALQQSLLMATRRTRWMTAFSVVLGCLAAALLALSLLLWRAARRLHREKHELQEAKRRDVERIANVETCLSVMRHDVSPFIGYLRSPNLSPELRSEVLEQLLRTFDNLKNWTHLSIPSGLVFNPSVFPLQEVFEAVRGQVITPAKGVELRVEATPLSLWGDRLLVTILLRNLVNNALQHTPSGHVTLSATPHEAMVQLSVTDSGEGMDAELSESLFRADRTVGDGEHGFGLILCRYIVKRHDDFTLRGCKIWVESTPGAGTAMHCLLAAGTAKQ